MSTRTRAGGFTLVELLVASAIFFSFTVGVLTVYARSHATFVRGQTRMEARQNARIALDTLAGELRMAGFDPSGAVDRDAGEPIVVVAEDSGLAFVADTDGDGTTDQVAYRFVGQRIERSVSRWTGSAFGAPERDVLAVGVEEFDIAYFGATASLTAPVVPGELPEIRRVSVRVMTSHEIASATSRYPLELDVTLRNASGAAP